MFSSRSTTTAIRSLRSIVRAVPRDVSGTTREIGHAVNGKLGSPDHAGQRCLSTVSARCRGTIRSYQRNLQFGITNTSVKAQTTSSSRSSRHYSSSSSSSASTASTAPTRPCPNCSAPLPLPLSPCPKCSTLVPLQSTLSLHSLLNLSQPVLSSSSSSSASTPDLDIPSELATLPARGFDLDPRSLRQTMLFRQRDLHPDKFANATATSIATSDGAGEGMGGAELAKELSGRVNEAYAVLSDPLRRAEYVLTVHGHPTEETDSLTDPMLLSDVLEAREELEEAQTEEEVAKLREANHEKVTETISALLSAFSSEPPDFALAKSLAIQLKYWLGLEHAAREWAPGKGAGPSAGSGFTHS